MNAEEPFDLALYWQVLRRRAGLLLIPIVLLTGILGLGSLIIPNIYRAQAQAVVRPELDPVKGLAVETQLSQQLGGVIQSLQQPSEQKRVFESLQAKQAVPPGVVVQDALSDYQSHLRIARREEGKDLIVDFVYEGTPEKYAVEVVNTFADEFQRQGTRLVATSLVVSLEFIEDQLASYRERLKELDAEEQRIRKRLSAELGDLAPLSAIEGLGKFIAARLADGEGEIQKQTLAIQSLEAQTSYLRAQLAATAETLVLRSGEGGGAGAGELERLVAEGEARLTALRMRYTDKHPDVITLREQLADLRAQMAESRAHRRTDVADVSNPTYDSLKRQTVQAEAELQFARAQRETLKERQERLRKVAAQVPAFEEQLRRVQDERGAVGATYENLLQRKQSLDLNQSFESGRNSGRFDIQPAGGVPLKPVRPNRLKFVVLGFLAGVFIGTAFMLLAEYLDHSIRSEADLKRYLDAPVLAVLPRAPR